MSAHRVVNLSRAVTAVAAVSLLSLLFTAIAFAAAPSPGTVPVDPRGGGEPPGFTGGPIEVLLLVVLIGVVAAVVTLVVVRLTGTGGET